MFNILNEDDERIEQPPNIQKQLFNHQKTIIKKFSNKSYLVLNTLIKIRSRIEI